MLKYVKLKGLIMNIFTNYDGASIDIIDTDINKNKIILSPKLENNNYANYYNFCVKNDTDKIGKIVITNLLNLQYPTSLKDHLPYFKSSNGDYKKIDNSRVKIINDSVSITIMPNENMEISSFPRYTMQDLDNYLKTILPNDNVTINNDILKEIIIGNPNNKTIFIIGRQHPGETLSSYFIEGIINGIINNITLLDNFCFVIIPIVNITGVKNGNHRFTHGYDYNRMWNSNGIINEIDFIKSEMSKYNIYNFIDVHCDEITNSDYIRTKDKKINQKFDNIQVINDLSKIRRLFRTLIKQKKFINIFDKTVREYVSSKYNCETMLIELSLSNCNKYERIKEGYDFITKMYIVI